MAIEPLTARQLQIADGIRRGLTYAEIAGELTRVNRRPISPLTVRTHVMATAETLRRFVEFALDENPDGFAPREVIARWMQQRNTNSVTED